MTVEEILTGVLDREGGWRDQVIRPDGSIDPPTNLGITLPVLRAWRAKYLGAPESETTIDDLRALTTDTARQIYATVFIIEPGFTSANIPYEPLRVQLIDFGVNSGTARAVRWLQRVLGMAAPLVTGKIDAPTRERISIIVGDWFGFDDTRGRLVNDALVAARVYMIRRAVVSGTIRKEDAAGLESRALSFFLARPVDPAPAAPPTSRAAD